VTGHLLALVQPVCLVPATYFLEQFVPVCLHSCSLVQAVSLAGRMRQPANQPRSAG
jgi:hypothetical protein